MQRTTVILLGLIVTFLIMGFLKLAGPVFIPFVVAFLLSFVLNPAVELLVRIRLPRIIAIIIVLVVLIGVGFLVGLVLYESIQSILADYSKYQRRYFEVIDFVSQTFNLPSDFFQNLELTRNLLKILGQFSQDFVGVLGDFTLVLIFLLFLFLEKPLIRRKLLDAVRHKETERIARIFAHISTQVGRYLMVKFFVSSLTGVVVGTGFSLIGVDFAVIWGILTFLFNFIPTIGSITISGITTMFAVVQFFPDYQPIILAIIAMVVPQLIIGNIIDPKMLGYSLNLSPVVILGSMLIWGYLWGIAGLFLAVPLTVGLKITFEHFSHMQYLGILMGTGTFSEKQTAGESARDAARDTASPRIDGGDSGGSQGADGDSGKP